MNAETLKIFRTNLLIQARAASHLGMTVNELVVGAKTQGFSTSKQDDVRGELQYLIDKKHIEKVPQEISPEVESFRATANGRDFLAGQGL